MAPPLLDLPSAAILVANVAAWVLGHVGAAAWANRLPEARLTADGPVLRLRSREHRGRWYKRRLRIRSWKDRIPEAGALFEGGISKAHLAASARGRRPTLEAFGRETRRGERAHWASLVVVPVCWIWNPPSGVALMALYGLAVNAPFIAVQRYNRARIEWLLARPTR